MAKYIFNKDKKLSYFEGGLDNEGKLQVYICSDTLMLNKDFVSDNCTIDLFYNGRERLPQDESAITFFNICVKHQQFYNEINPKNRPFDSKILLKHKGNYVLRYNSRYGTKYLCIDKKMYDGITKANCTLFLKSETNYDKIGDLDFYTDLIGIRANNRTLLYLKEDVQGICMPIMPDKNIIRVIDTYYKETAPDEVVQHIKSNTCQYLNDFFEKVLKVDPRKIGEYISSQLIERCTEEELLDLYIKKVK